MVVSVATGYDPVLENDDAKPRPHGLEHAASGGTAARHRAAHRRHRHGYKAACDSGVCVLAKNDGIVGV